MYPLILNKKNAATTVKEVITANFSIFLAKLYELEGKTKKFASRQQMPSTPETKLLIIVLNDGFLVEVLNIDFRLKISAKP